MPTKDPKMRRKSADKSFYQTQIKLVNEFIYYTEYSDEFHEACRSDVGHEITEMLTQAFKLIEENSTQ